MKISLELPGNWPDDKSQEERIDYIIQALREERKRVLESKEVVRLINALKYHRLNNKFIFDALDAFDEFRRREVE